MGISPEVIEEIKGRLDLVEVVSTYLPLRRAGRNLIGLCPFHREKTPSFTVNPERQFFHCFGCKASGDVISFVMKVENLDFSEAVEILAERAGVEIPEESGGKEDLEGIRKAYAVACRYYAERLFSRAGEQALDHLARRGVNREWAERFGMGYAPGDASGFISALESEGLSRRHLVEWGLIGKREDGSLYPRFRDRLMIPIHDEKGRVIAFGGRALQEGQEPKYLNSPDTPLFQKGRTIFAYHLAKKSAREKGVILVEGYMDVVACHIHGFDNAVAALGTAFTPIQARKVERLSKKVFLLFDADEAGWKATLRTGEVFLHHGVVPRVVGLPQGEDPDSMLRKEGTEAFARALEESQDFVLSVFSKVAGSYDLSKADQRSTYASEMARLVGRLGDPVLQDSYLMELSRLTGIERAVLRDAAAREEGRKRPATPRRRKREGIHWEEMLLGVLFAKPSLWADLRGDIDPSLFRIGAMREAVEAIERYASPQMAMPALGEEARERVTRAILEIPPGEEESVVKGCMERLRGRRLKKEIEEVKEALSSARDTRDRQALSQRYLGLMRDLKSIRRGEDVHEEL